MLKKSLILLISSLLISGCGLSGDKKLYAANVTYTGMVKSIENYAEACNPKPKDDVCHANVDKAAKVLAEVHPIIQDARKYTGADVDAGLRELAEANTRAALEKLLPIAKELGYVKD